jgi:hypothetical protein
VPRQFPGGITGITRWSTSTDGRSFLGEVARGERPWISVWRCQVVRGAGRLTDAVPNDNNICADWVWNSRHCDVPGAPYALSGN